MYIYFVFVSVADGEKKYYKEKKLHEVLKGVASLTLYILSADVSL